MLEITREEFEEDLIKEDIYDYFISKDKEKVEREFNEKVSRMIGFEQKNSHQCYDLWGHTLKTVEGIKEEQLTKEQFIKLRVAAFFHDIGKPDVSKFNERTGQQVFYGHATKSAEVAKSILEELNYSEDEISHLSFYIAHHDDFINYKSKINDKQKNHEFIREVNTDNLVERIIENRFDFPKMGYDTDQIRAIVYELAHNVKPNFKNFKEEKIVIPVDICEVKEKIKSKEYDRNFNPSLDDYKMLILLCKADANAQSEIAKRVLADGREVIDGTKIEKIENMNKVELFIDVAYEKANSIIENINSKSNLQELKDKKMALETKKKEVKEMLINLREKYNTKEKND